MTNASARMRNLARTFERVLEGGTLTRGDLTEATGLSKATVARLVTELEEAGLVEARGIDAAEGPGRRPRGLGVPSALGHVLGFSFGLRSSHAVALDLSGRTIGSRLEPTPAFAPGDDIAAWAAEMLTGFASSLEGCGASLRVCVALPGRVRNGIPISALPEPLAGLTQGTRRSHDQPGSSTSFVCALETALRARVTLATDADMALSGATSCGYVEPEASAVLFTLSTALTVSTRTRLGVVQPRTSAFGDYAVLPFAPPKDAAAAMQDGGVGTELQIGSLLSVRGMNDFLTSQRIGLSDISELWEQESSETLRVRQVFSAALEAAILVAARAVDPEVCVLTGRLAPLASIVLPELQARLDVVLEDAPHVIVPGTDDNGFTTALGSANAALTVERARFVDQVHRRPSAR